LGAADAELRGHVGRTGQKRLGRRQQLGLGVFAFVAFVVIGLAVVARHQVFLGASSRLRCQPSTTGDDSKP